MADAPIASGQPALLAPATPVTTGAEPLNLRADGAIIHLVDEGDTLLAIAIRYSLTLPELLAFNEGMTNDSFVQLNQEIVVGFVEPTATTTPLATLTPPLATATATATPSPKPPTPTPAATITPAPPTASEEIAASDLAGTVLQATAAPTTSDAAAPDESTPAPGRYLLPALAAVALLGGLLLVVARRR